MSEAYAITLHHAAPAIVHTSLGELIQSDPKMRGWWNHVPYVFLVTTEHDASELSALIKPAVKAWLFPVMKVDLDSIQGRLPDQAWGWMQRRAA